MVIIYGGIQPDGLVLSIHTVTIDTSKRNRSTVLPGLITPRPTFPPTPPPIRGTVPPLSKWAPYDQANPRRSSLSPPLDSPTQSDARLRDWANRMFQFRVNEDALDVTTHKTMTSTATPRFFQTSSAVSTTGSSDHTLANAKASLQSEKASPIYQILTSAKPKSREILHTNKHSTTASPPLSKLLHRSQKNPLVNAFDSTTEEISLENLLLQTLDKLADQYKNSSNASIKN